MFIQEEEEDDALFVGVEECDDVPVAALRPSSQNILSRMLNPIKVIPTDGGLPRDWRGLAELGGLGSQTIAHLQSQIDPTAQLLQLWCKSSDSRCKFFSDLKAFLAVIDRYDVVEDVNPLLITDAQAYRECQRDGAMAVTSPLDPLVDKNVLTIEDSERVHRGLPLTIYDAFILYAEEDAAFADEIVHKLEQDYGLKLCVKDRDLLPGTMFEHEVIGRLIEERCNRFLVIFSPNFNQSPANQFLVSYAQASALESRHRKIVPCMYEPCELPPSVRYSFCIKYNRSGKIYNFWDKLNQSLRNSSFASQTRGLPSSSALLSEKLRDPLSDESLKWLDSDKTPSSKPTPPPTYSQTMKDMSSLDANSKSESLTDPDTFSISSNARLLSSEKGKHKWLKKIKNPMKKKRDKDKSTNPQTAVAE